MPCDRNQPYKVKREFFDEQYVADEALQVIGRADVVALALPGGDDTRHIINKEEVVRAEIFIVSLLANFIIAVILEFFFFIICFAGVKNLLEIIRDD